MVSKLLYELLEFDSFHVFKRENMDRVIFFDSLSDAINNSRLVPPLQ